MAWAGGVLNTYATDIGSMTQGVNTYYDKRFLRGIVEQLRIAPLGQKRPLPRAAGRTIEFFRYNQITPSMSSANLTDGTNPDPTQITGQTLDAVIAEWGGFSQHSRLLSDVHIDRKLEGITDLWSNHAASIIDLNCQMKLAGEGAYPVNADATAVETAAAWYEGVVDSATSTTMTDAVLETYSDFGDANDDLNQSIIVITSGTGYGQSRPITDYATSGGVCTVEPAWDVTPAADDTYVIASPHLLTAGTDILTTKVIRYAVAKLRMNKATPVSSGYYVGVLDPETEAGLMADTNWTNVMSYKDRPEIKTGGLFAGEVGEWGGVRWVRTTLPYRFPIVTVGTASHAGGVGPYLDGTEYTNYSASGAIHASFILGREAFGCTTLEGNNFMKPGIIKKKPGPQDTSNPLDRFSTVGWYLPFVAKGLNPMFAVQIWSRP